MIDQLLIGGKASFDDFQATVASRKIGMPPKKSIKETVPFSNKTYDFSRINGELYWEERELEYVFEILAATPEQLEEAKAAFADWVMNVVEEQIHDPFIPFHHFIGTFADIDPEDDDGLDKATITVTFTAYPYKVANDPTVFSVEVPAASERTLVVLNGSSHRITPTVSTDAEVVLKHGNASYAMPAGEYSSGTPMLEPGATSLVVQNAGGTACTVSVSFHEEVF